MSHSFKQNGQTWESERNTKALKRNYVFLNRTAREARVLKHIHTISVKGAQE